MKDYRKVADDSVESSCKTSWAPFVTLLRLFINKPGEGGAGQAMSDGTIPAPGGWNRFHLEVKDLESTVEKLKRNGAIFRNEIISGVGGKQALLEDPSGNFIELFQPANEN